MLVKHEIIKKEFNQYSKITNKKLSDIFSYYNKTLNKLHNNDNIYTELEYRTNLSDIESIAMAFTRDYALFDDDYIILPKHKLFKYKK